MCGGRSIGGDVVRSASPAAGLSVRSGVDPGRPGERGVGYRDAGISIAAR